MRLLPSLLCLAACDSTFEPDPPALVASQSHALAIAGTQTLVATAGMPGAADNLVHHGTETPRPVDAQGNATVLDLPFAVDVAVGQRHACVLSETGSVHCWGDHTGAALGAHRACIPPAVEGGTPDCVLPAMILPALPPAVAIAAGDDVTCAILEDNARVVCWGDATRTGGSTLPALDPPTPVALPDGSALAATRVVIDSGSVCAIDPAQRLWCWGDRFGATPALQPFDGVVDVAIGRRHSCVIDARGLGCWGDNRNAQLGDYRAARACTNDAPCRIDERSPIHVEATRVVVGERHTCALEPTGGVVCFGSNEVGQLGRQDAFLVGDVGRTPLAAPALAIEAGYAHTCALLETAETYCWGSTAETPTPVTES